MAPGVSSVLPVYIERGEGAILVDVDGNALIDLGSGIAVTSVGHAVPAVVDAVRGPGRPASPTPASWSAPTRVTWRCASGSTPSPRAIRQDVGAVQLGGRGGRERGQDRPPCHRPPGGDRLRPRLPRPHQPDDGPHGQEHALQGRLRAVRARGLPGADVVSVPGPGRVHRRRRRRPGRRADREAGGRGQRGLRPDRADPGRGRVRGARPGLPARPGGLVPATTASCSSPTRCSRASAAPGPGSRASTRGSCPTWSPRPRGSPAGMPLAAVTGRAEIMGHVHVGGLGGTYGGNPVACAAALAAIDHHGASADLAGAARRIGTVVADRLRRPAGGAIRPSATCGVGAPCRPWSWSQPGTTIPDPRPRPRPSPRPATPRAWWC